MSVTDSSYAAVMERRNAIMKASLGIDYDDFVAVRSRSTTSA